MPDRRVIEEQQAQYEAGRLSLAQIALIGIAGWAGVRHFPRHILARAADAIERRAPPKLLEWLPKLYDDIGRTSRGTLAGATPHANDARLYQSQPRIQDLYLESDLSRAIEYISGTQPLGGSADVVAGYLTNQAHRYGGLNPYPGLRRATVGDALRARQRGLNAEPRVVGDHIARLNDYLQGSLHGVASEWSRLSALPSFQRAIKRRGMSSEQLAEQVVLGPGMFFDTQKDQFLGATRLTPKRIARWLVGDPSAAPEQGLLGFVKDRRIPFTTFKPLSLLVPTEMFRDAPEIARVDKRILGAAESEAAEGALFVGGKLHPLRDKQVLKPIEGQFNLGSTHSGMAIGAAARYQRTQTVHGDGRTFEFDDPTLASLVKGGQVEHVGGRFVVTDKANPARLRVAEITQKVGIGPQYSQRAPLGGRPRLFFEGMMNRTRGKVEFAAEVTQGIAQPGNSNLPEVELFRNLGRKTGLNPLPRSYQDLTFGERVMLQAGGTIKRDLSVTRSGRTVRGAFDVAKWTEGPFSALDSHPNLSLVPELRRRSFTGDWYAYKPHHGLQDWLNFQAMRPSWLTEEMAGIGVRGAKTPVGSLAQLTLGLAVPLYFGAEAAKYVEYKSAQVFGMGPITALGHVYAGAHIGFQKMLEEGGIVEQAQSLEDKYPGLISSDLSGLARGAAGVATGMAVGRATGTKMGAVASLLAGLATGFLGSQDITQTADELVDVYSGVRGVPVRKNRWWALGLDPFSGSEIEYYETHWLPQMKSWAKERTQWGSVRESWRGSWLPTPENAFLLKNLFDPYYIERENYASRPYPLTGTYLSDVPVFGPLLGATVGQAFKPTRRMHPDYWTAGTVTDPSAPRLQGAQSQYMEQLGYAVPQLYNRPSSTRNRMETMMQQQAYELFEFSGLPGFMYGAMYTNITGGDLFDKQAPMVASADTITDAYRAYNDQRLGGLLGGTELVRRMIARKIGRDINPISNTMPDWLPGYRSPHKQDHDYYLDFHRGDAYAQVTKGESRLPGLGYESVHGLHSGIPGVYDPVDRFLVLADIAPTSQAFQEYKTIVESWGAAGMISQKYKKRVGIMMQQVQEKLQSTAWEHNPWEYEYDKQQMTIDEVLSATKFRSGKQVFELAGVISPSQASALWAYEGDALKRKQDALASVGSKLQSMVGQSVTATVGPPGTVSTPVIIPGLTQDAIEQGLGNTVNDPIHMQARAGGEADMFMRMWQNFRHAQLPGPFNTIARKLWAKPTPLQAYKEEVLFGYHYSDWTDPFGTWVKPWAYQMADMAGFDFVPPEVQSQRNLTEYFDTLRYTKARSLQAEAEMAGNNMAASYFKRQAGGTMRGFPAAPTQPNMLAALPKHERPYFKAFTAATPEMQSQLLNLLPEGTHDIYMSAWSRGKQNSMMSSPLLARGSDAGPGRTMRAIDQDVAEYFTSHHLPDSSWTGWHPGVDLTHYEVKTIQNEAMDIHDFGYWGSDVEAAAMLPYVEPITGLQQNRSLNSTMARLRQMNIRPSSYNDLYGQRLLRIRPGSYHMSLQDRDRIRKGSL